MKNLNLNKKKLYIIISTFFLFLTVYFICALYKTTPPNAKFLYLDVPETNYKMVMDIQAETAFKNGLLDRFEPNCTKTVVFAVNKDETDFIPKSWSDLLKCPDTISIKSQDIYKICTIASLAYSLDGDDFSKESAIDFLKQLNKTCDFKLQNENTAITICFDSDAYARLSYGENIEIIVPSDGTLFFNIEMSSKEDNSLISKDILKSMGYVIPDEISEIYPSAHNIKDVDHFNKETYTVTKDLRKKVFKTHLFTSSYGIDHYLYSLFTIIIVILLTAISIYKSAQKFTRNCIITISIMSICLLLISLLKYNISNPYFNRFLWYSYYIFFMGLPLVLLSLSIFVDKHFRRSSYFKKMLPFFISYPILVFLVLTNDIHNLIFKITSTDSPDYTYTHNWGFYIIFAYSIIIFLIALFTLIYKSRKSPKRFYVIWPIILAILFISFLVTHLIGVPIVKNFHLTRTFTIFTMLFIQTIIYSGLVPRNTHYKDLFTHIGKDIKLIDTNNNIFLYTGINTPENINSNDIITHTNKIHGGRIVWTEDISTLNVLHNQIEQNVNMIEKANKILIDKKNQQELVLTTKIKNDLLDSLEKDMAKESVELKYELSELESSEDKFKKLSYITFLLCHIKRKCNMFFLFAQNNNISSTDLLVYIDELSEFSKSDNLKSVVRCNIIEEIEIQKAILIYDFYFILLKYFKNITNSILIGKLNQTDNSTLFNFIVSHPVDKCIFSNDFLADLFYRGGRLNIKEIDDMDVAEIIFTKTEEGDL